MGISKHLKKSNNKPINLSLIFIVIRIPKHNNYIVLHFALRINVFIFKKKTVLGGCTMFTLRLGKKNTLKSQVTFNVTRSKNTVWMDVVQTCVSNVKICVSNMQIYGSNCHTCVSLWYWCMKWAISSANFRIICLSKYVPIYKRYLALQLYTSIQKIMAPLAACRAARSLKSCQLSKKLLATQ